MAHRIETTNTNHKNREANYGFTSIYIYTHIRMLYTCCITFTCFPPRIYGLAVLGVYVDDVYPTMAVPDIALHKLKP